MKFWVPHKARHFLTSLLTVGFWKWFLLLVWFPAHKFTRSPCSYYWLQGLRTCQIGGIQRSDFLAEVHENRWIKIYCWCQWTQSVTRCLWGRYRRTRSKMAWTALCYVLPSGLRGIQRGHITCFHSNELQSYMRRVGRRPRLRVRLLRTCNGQHTGHSPGTVLETLTSCRV
jgi:hypothetical protein